MGFLLVAAIFLVLFSIESELHFPHVCFCEYYLSWSLLFIVAGFGIFGTLESKSFMSGGFFMLPGFFFFFAIVCF